MSRPPERSPLSPSPSEPLAALRVLVVDDEPLARDCVRLALRDERDVELVAECGDGVEAVAAIEALRPDVVLLDVQMPGVDGFGVVEQVGVERMPAVVFVTAFDAHAIRAFEVHALDYVLKPFDNARLRAALGRARAQVRARAEGERARQLASLLAGWARADAAPPPPRRPSDEPAAEAQSDGGWISRLTVRDADDRIRFVAAADVDWIEADGNYALLHVGPAAHRVRLAIRTLAERLDPRRFVRVHRSAIVNVDRIREVQPWFGGDYVAILHTGARVRVSRTHAGGLLKPIA
jgi:two-component system LytT family response regulator